MNRILLFLALDELRARFAPKPQTTRLRALRRSSGWAFALPLALCALPGCTLLSGPLTLRCGDGILNLDREDCDDGNAVDGDGCNSDCLDACGDGKLDADEGCDDGNLLDADGCEADCTLPACNNGIVDPGELCYAPPVSVAVGTLPRDLAIDDIDLDGDLDVAVVHQISNDASVLLNDGAGALSEAARFQVGLSPFGVDIADTAAGGLPELLVSVGGENVVKAFGNAGNGSFIFLSQLAVGVTPFGVVAADLSGDGALDFACTNINNNNITVSVAGQVPQNVVAGGQPHDIEVGELNGQPGLDLVVTNRLSGALTVFLNQGNGVFAAPVLLELNAIQTGAAVGDVNGDGRDDIVATLELNDLVVVFLQGAGGFQAPLVFGVSGDHPFYVKLGDLDGDGDLDIITSNSLTGDLSLLLNETGAFVEGVTLPTKGDPLALDLADLNGDGFLDIVVGETGADTVSVFLASDRLP
jgi:cysteine-rich repeat protein